MLYFSILLCYTLNTNDFRLSQDEGDKDMAGEKAEKVESKDVRLDSGKPQASAKQPTKKSGSPPKQQGTKKRK